MCVCARAHAYSREKRATKFRSTIPSRSHIVLEKFTDKTLASCQQVMFQFRGGNFDQFTYEWVVSGYVLFLTGQTANIKMQSQKETYKMVKLVESHPKSIFDA